MPEQGGNGATMTSFSDVDQFRAKMRVWAKSIEQRLNGAPDIAALHAEADELRQRYEGVPSELYELERSKAEKLFELGDLRPRFALIEDQATLEAEGKNAEQRKANVRLALAQNEDAVEMASHISQLEFEIKLVEAEIQEKERVWSDYHRQTIILAAKAGITYR